MLHVASLSDTTHWTFSGLSSQPQTFHFPGSFSLEYGGFLPEVTLCYECNGPKDGPVIVVQGGISANCHVASRFDNPQPGWWEEMVGIGKAIDTQVFRVISFDYLGGPGRSSHSHNPGTSLNQTITTRDQARACALLLDHLGVEKVKAFVGASYGGMVGLAFAESFGNRLDRLLAISAPGKPAPMAKAWRIVQRQIVRFGLKCGNSVEALAIARGLAMTTYRTAEEFADRFDGPPVPLGTGFGFPLETYLETCGAKFTKLFDPHSFLCLCESLDLHDVLPERIQVPTQLVAFTTDQLVPLEDLRDLKRSLKGPSSIVEIDSRYGHDGFLKEIRILGSVISKAIQG